MSSKNIFHLKKLSTLCNNQKIVIGTIACIPTTNQLLFITRDWRFYKTKIYKQNFNKKVKI